MPRPRSLSTTDLVSATLAVIDRGDLSALTMRAVANELNMATMSLYRYVADRGELELLVVDQVLGAVDISTPPDAEWRARVALLVDRMRAAISAHPAIAPLVPRHRHDSTSAMRWMNAMLGALADGGFHGRARVIAQRTVIAFLLGFLENQHYAAIGGRGTAVLAKLPAEEYPFLAATAAEARKLVAEDEFRGGLEIVLRGLVPGE
ncbi:TetR/AcrR family transcriptional regulator C-terminal domain-containing protein [Nocardia sp. NPDC052566]|uniref:TetR/AcrR family transcriptional regulator C-terminal domain-containing protein n=1 Tax=Nocardia sp. NPDC052566 TaxID=3364330 RepID=UPI0037C75381